MWWWRHSLGTVIAYDVLTGRGRRSRCRRAGHAGQPAGAVRRAGGGSRPPGPGDDGWPTQRLGAGSWTNVADRLDPVCGFDAAIGPDFRRGGVARVVDVAVTNEGRWRHSIVKYLRQHAGAPSAPSSVRRHVAMTPDGGAAWTDALRAATNAYDWDAVARSSSST